jgi:ATP-dependent Lhr-like helicase
LTEAEVQSGAGKSSWLVELAGEKRAARLHLPTGTLWIAAERLPVFRALWPNPRLDPPIAAPAAHAEREWSPEAALIEIVRGRLEGQGPVTLDALAAPLGLERTAMAGALAALEAEGFAMRGQFTPAAEEEWCERRLLARIHGYTIKRLRAEIEPVAARDFLRFLLAWQRVEDGARMEGPDALDEVVGQLEGFEAPAGGWETEIPPACRLRAGLAR